MANGTTSPQSGGIMDAIGSGVKGLAGIAGQILPYALPIGLGAVMGHGLPGGALGGGAAGLATAYGAMGERERLEEEARARQAQLAHESRRDDLLEQSLTQKGTLGEEALKIKQQQADTQADRAKAYTQSLTDRNEHLRTLDSLNAQRISIAKANLGLRGEALKQGQEKLDDITRQQEAEIQKLAEAHSKLVTSDHWYVSGTEEEKAQKKAADDLIDHFHSIGIGIAPKASAATKSDPNAKIKKAPVPPIPAGSKPVYDDSGKLVGYKHD